MSEPLWSVLRLTLQVALTATAGVLVPGIALAWLLARRRFPGHTLLDATVNLPMFLPPTAVGLGLLLLLGPEGPIGSWLERALGVQVTFTWWAAVVAAGVVSFPLLVRSVRSALEEVDDRLVAVARSLGHRPFGAFLAVELPLAWRGILAGTVLTFTRALGEFGATVLVAGNIPGRTQTLALALFQRVQVGDDRGALALAGVAAAIAFAALLAAERLLRRRERRLELAPPPDVPEAPADRLTEDDRR